MAGVISTDFPDSTLKAKRNRIVSGIIESLRKIEKGSINSTDMLCRMLLIEGSEAWKDKGISSLLEDAQAHVDPDAKLSVDRGVYFHIAAKALSEAQEGSSVGFRNAIESLEKAFGLSTGALKGASIEELKLRMPDQLPKLIAG